MRTRIVAVAALLSLAAPVAGRAAPVDPPLSSENVELVVNLPTGVGIGGKFAGNHYFQTTARAGSYLPGTASTGGLVVLDVSDPERPKPAGFLPLPIWQNEDVDLSPKRKLLLIANDRRKSVSQVSTSPIIAATLFVIDIANPNAPVLKSKLDLPAQVGETAAGAPLGGPGHTATCVLDCTYAYVSGSRDRSVWLVDLRDPAAPAVVGPVRTPAAADSSEFDPGSAHDVHVDAAGYLWMVGSGGTALYAPVRDPRRPRLLASVAPSDNARLNQLIHHGVVRLDKNVVLVGEEAFEASDCGGSDGEQGAQDGSLQTWRIDLARKRLVPLDTWDADRATNVALNGCSSHWFDVNDRRVVADAWYGQGVRFLDVSNPKAIRQVGWWLPPGTAAGQAQFVPGRPDLVYVSDYNRGLDVIRIASGGRGAPTVRVAPNAGAGGRTRIRFEPHPEFGYACAVAAAP